MSARNVALVASAVGVSGLIIYALAKNAKAAAPPKRIAPPGYDENGNPLAPTTPSPIQSGKPHVIVGPGPFDPVSSDWKKGNAPSWWPW